MRDKEFIDLNRAYLQICEQQKVGVPVGNKSDAEALKGLIPKGEKVHEVPRKTTLQKANYEPEGELVADETDLFYESAAGGIVGGVAKSPVAKPAVRGIKKPVPAPAKVSENQEFEMWVNSLVEDGYDLSEYTWDDMYEMYVNAGENESDLFDYILEYLVAKGFADTNENALVIMANMSEEWRQDIVEATLSAKAARAGKDIGKPGKMFSKIAKEAGERYGSEERGKKVAGAVLAKMREKASH